VGPHYVAVGGQKQDGTLHGRTEKGGEKNAGPLVKRGKLPAKTVGGRDQKSLPADMVEHPGVSRGQPKKKKGALCPKKKKSCTVQPRKRQEGAEKEGKRKKIKPQV